MARRMSSGTCRAPGQQLRSAIGHNARRDRRFFIAAISNPARERAARAVTGRLISAIAGSRPVPLPDFGEAARWLRPLIVRVLSPARLTMILIHKILTTSETEN